MNRNDPNVVLLELVADRLEARLRERLVFVGGAVAGLLITDPAAPAIRPTEDVDLVARVAALPGFHAIEHELAELGFAHDVRSGAPICRWRIDGVAVDVMPTDESILGFSNRWYPLAVETAERVALPSGLKICLLQAPVFIATKLEAFAGRGNSDFLLSHDLGDLVAVVDGRDSLIAECQTVDVSLKAYLGEQFSHLLQAGAFMDALPGHLPGDQASQDRLPDLEGKLQALAGLR
ncbi:MAG TPA: hypothetical protein VFK45_00045 [Gammaproteobacteria bacterium]|nr:hypothetical protein [Gammaproteobacteria bacterium]